ncbi:MAG: type II toxin-antitoxin system antitoxin [Chloroflexota bacterium]
MAEKKRFLLRLSPQLWEEINSWAAQDFRSVNAQIEFLLQRAVEDRRRGPPRAARRAGAARPEEAEE